MEGGLCSRAVRLTKGKWTVMDRQSDRKQLERKLEQCRRLSVGTSDSTTSARLAKLIEELEHSLREDQQFTN
jgi:hypothetical protein